MDHLKTERWLLNLMWLLLLLLFYHCASRGIISTIQCVVHISSGRVYGPCHTHLSRIILSKSQTTFTLFKTFIIMHLMSLPYLGFYPPEWGYLLIVKQK
jgi:hypothetical protein